MRCVYSIYIHIHTIHIYIYTHTNIRVYTCIYLKLRVGCYTLVRLAEPSDAWAIVTVGTFENVGCRPLVDLIITSNTIG